MTHKIHIGCADLAPGLRRLRYFEQLSFLESSLLYRDYPSTKILKKWRLDAPSANFAVTVPKACVQKNFAEAATQMPAFFAACTLLRPSVAIIKTDCDFTPSQKHRDLFSEFVTQLRQQIPELTLVWEPSGLWEPKPSCHFAKDLDVMVSMDPLRKDPIDKDPLFFQRLPLQKAYFKISGVGKPKLRLTPYDQELLTDLASCYKETWIVLDHSRKYPDAISLQKQFQDR